MKHVWGAFSAIIAGHVVNVGFANIIIDFTYFIIKSIVEEL